MFVIYFSENYRPVAKRPRFYSRHFTVSLCDLENGEREPIDNEIITTICLIIFIHYLP